MELIVIGGSAGALDALLAIVPALPDELVTPILVALHVSPHHPSRLADLLGRHATRPVCEPEDKQPIRAGTIYVAPPDYHLLVERNETCALSVDAPLNYSRPSIDMLFDSAADAFGPAVTGVVLSGANDDGARGLARIFAAGGCCVVQSPSAAPHAAMPTAAVQRAREAHVLAVGEIVPFLARRAVIRKDRVAR